MDQIANVIIWVIIIQGIFLGFTYIFSKKSKSKANKILGLFLLAFVFEAYDVFVSNRDEIAVSASSSSSFVLASSLEASQSLSMSL